MDRPLETEPVSAEAAVTTLYATHWPHMVRLAWLLVHDDLLAEECAQDAFVAVHRRWGDLREVDAATAYLRRAVVNNARSQLRHRGVEERYRSSVAADPRSRMHVASAEEGAVARAQRDELFGALQALPTRQREVLTLRYYLDLSEAEIADTLGVARGSVKAHASRGLATLRARLGESR